MNESRTALFVALLLGAIHLTACTNEPPSVDMLQACTDDGQCVVVSAACWRCRRS